VALANQLGLTVNRGVVVDAQMRTSVPAIFAAGDVAEFNGQTLGLWPVAVSQAETAAANAVAPLDATLATYRELVPVTMLKVVGVDLTSIGQIEAQESSESEIVLAEPADNRYRKLVIADGKVVGAILLGYPALAPAIAELSKQGLAISSHLPALRNGDWDVLKTLVAVSMKEVHAEA
jgi:nitrite reductase (NADH) large subunit